MQLCVLRASAGVGCNDQRSVLSNGITNVSFYPSRIRASMEKFKRHYTDKKTGALHASYNLHMSTLLDVVVECVTGNVWKEDSVFALLRKHHTDVFNHNIVLFIQSVENKVCIVYNRLLLFSLFIRVFTILAGAANPSMSQHPVHEPVA